MFSQNGHTVLMMATVVHGDANNRTGEDFNICSEHFIKNVDFLTDFSFSPLLSWLAHAHLC